jgi:hypothetical protein
VDLEQHLYQDGLHRAVTGRYVRANATLAKAEILRCLKRYLAREHYRILIKPPASLSSPADGDDAQPSKIAS